MASIAKGIFQLFMGNYYIPVFAGIQNEPGTLYRVINYLIYLITMLMVANVFTNFNKYYREALINSRIFALIKPFLAIVFFGLVTGFIFRTSLADMFRALGLEMLPVLSIIIILVVSYDKVFKEKLLNMLVLQSIFSIIFALVAVIIYPVPHRSMFLYVHYEVMYLLWPSYFLIPLLPKLKNVYKVTSLLSFLMLAYYEIIYQTRGGTIITLLIYPLIILTGLLRRKKNIKYIIPYIGICLSVYFIISLASADSFLYKQFLTGIEGTLERLFSLDFGGTYTYHGVALSFQRELTISRGLEALQFIKQADLFTWIFGRGWGGTWHAELFSLVPHWKLVHFGPLHFVLKGGVLLSIIFHLIIFNAIYTTWKRIPIDDFAIAEFSCCVVFYSFFLKYGELTPNYSTFIFWLIMGCALYRCTPNDFKFTNKSEKA